MSTSVEIERTERARWITSTSRRTTSRLRTGTGTRGSTRNSSANVPGPCASTSAIVATRPKRTSTYCAAKCNRRSVVSHHPRQDDGGHLHYSRFKSSRKRPFYAGEVRIPPRNRCRPTPCRPKPKTDATGKSDATGSEKSLRREPRRPCGLSGPAAPRQAPHRSHERGKTGGVCRRTMC